MHKSVISKKYRGQGMTSGRFVGGGGGGGGPTPGSGPAYGPQVCNNQLKQIIYMFAQDEMCGKYTEL